MIPSILAAVPRPARLFLLVAAIDTVLFSLLRGVFVAVFWTDFTGLPARLPRAGCGKGRRLFGVCMMILLCLRLTTHLDTSR